MFVVAQYNVIEVSYVVDIEHRVHVVTARGEEEEYGVPYSREID